MQSSSCILFQARTQPLSKGGYIVVERGEGDYTFDCVLNNNYAQAAKPTAHLGESGGMLPQKILEI